MKTVFVRSLVLVALFAACGDSKKTTAPAVSAEAGQVRKAKADGARTGITVVGRVADIIRGRAAFTLMDTELPYCGETNKEDHCKTPWDYCCESKERQMVHTLFVEERGADGKTLATALPDLRLLDKVEVKGDVVVDEHGNPTFVAKGIRRVERPELPKDLKWPQ